LKLLSCGEDKKSTNIYGNMDNQYFWFQKGIGLISQNQRNTVLAL
tara:strand:- start:1412 stop:1546 length:135 start_codon:yes stop_codon:yes gene_type:complete